MVFIIFLVAIFCRPFISSLAFPYLDFVYSLVFFIFLVIFAIFKKALFVKFKPVIFPLVFFLLALIISVVFSKNKLNSLWVFYKYLSMIFLFLVAAALPEKEKLLVIKTIVSCAFLVSCMAIYQYFFGFKHVLSYLSEHKVIFPFALDYLQSKRVFVPFVTPGILGGYLVMMIPLCFIIKNSFWLILPVFIALLLTKSLGAFLGLFCVLVIFFCLRGKFKNKQIFVLAGLWVVMILIFILRSLTQRAHLSPVFSVGMRLGYWHDALAIIKAHPLVGIGLGNFTLGMSRYAHNSYLQILAEMGPLGLAALIWFVFVVIKSRLKDLIQPFYNNQTMCLLMASCVFLIHNLLDFSFFLPEVAYLWWVILGLVVL